MKKLICLLMAFCLSLSVFGSISASAKEITNVNDVLDMLKLITSGDASEEQVKDFDLNEDGYLTAEDALFALKKFSKKASPLFIDISTRDSIPNGVNIEFNRGGNVRLEEDAFFPASENNAAIVTSLSQLNSIYDSSNLSFVQKFDITDYDKDFFKDKALIAMFVEYDYSAPCPLSIISLTLSGDELVLGTTIKRPEKPYQAPMRFVTFVEVAKTDIKDVSKFSRVDTVQTYKPNQDKKIIYDDSIYSNNFVDNEVIVGISHEMGLRMKKLTKEDFPEVEEIISIEEDTFSWSLDNWDKSNFKIETYNFSVVVVFDFHDKAKVIQAIRQLEKLDFVRYAETNGISSPD
jgi:hypothetical protein